jgi:hypothetical protein
MKLRSMTVVGALAALALVGCTSNGRSGEKASDQQQSLNETRQDAQQDLAQARQEGSQNVNEAQQNLEKTKQEAQQNVNETAQAGQQEIQEQRQDIAKDRQESATGGSGAAMASQSGTVTGTLSDMDEKSLTIKDSAGNEVALQRNASTTVTQNGKTIAADQLQKGSEVRASFKVDANGDKQAQSISLEAAPSQNTMNPDQNQ